jgi:uncharacterized protein
MDLKGEATLLRIFIGEADKVHHTPLYEMIVKEARALGIAGATTWRGTLGYGQTSHLRSARVLDLSVDLPVIVEIVDEQAKIERLLTRLQSLFEEANSGGLVTVEKVEVIRYVSKK